MNFELNTVNNVKDDVNVNPQLNSKSAVVEIFSAIIDGKDTSHFGKKVDKSVSYIKSLAEKASFNDGRAISELNTIQRYAIEPKLIEAIKIFEFMGTYKSIGYDVQPMMKTYKHESVDSRFQASSSDVPFATTSWREYPINTMTISGGYAIDYREVQSGNFDGVAEGMDQVKIDMQNKSVYYVIAKLYDAIKHAKGVKHFSETVGVTEQSVKEMLNVMRRYGKPSISGDYSVTSRLNDFAGHKTFGSNTIGWGEAVVAEEIRKNGLLSFYNGAPVVELPNGYNYTKVKTNSNGEKTFDLYMPEGLLFIIPKAAVSPLQIFKRGGMTTMTGDDIVTRQRLTRFDMELGAGVAEGMEHQIGLISDLDFEVPTL